MNGTKGKFTLEAYLSLNQATECRCVKNVAIGNDENIFKNILILFE